MAELDHSRPRSGRRRRRRSAQILHQLKIWSPLALVAIAAMLSAGVVQVMEVGRPARVVDGASVPEAVSPSVESPSEPPRQRRALDLQVNPNAPAEIEDVLSVSILDESPEPAAKDERVPASEPRTDGIHPPLDLMPEISPVPEPTTLFLVGGGLVWISVGQRHS